MNKKMTLSGLAVAMFFMAGLAGAAGHESVQEKSQQKMQDRERPTVGRELMTEEERNAQRAKMRSSTKEEREKARAEHHEEMKERANEQGASIPDEPSVRGQGMGAGQGGGQGGGMGGGRGGR